MNRARYRELKAKGTITLRKLTKQVIVEIKNYDPDTGEEKPDIINELSIDELRAEKNKLQEQIAEINEVIQDITALNDIKDIR